MGHPVHCYGFLQVADLRGRGQGKPGQCGWVDVRSAVLPGGRQAGERAQAVKRKGERKAQSPGCSIWREIQFCSPRWRWSTTFAPSSTPSWTRLSGWTPPRKLGPRPRDGYVLNLAACEFVVLLPCVSFTSRCIERIFKT